MSQWHGPSPAPRLFRFNSWHPLGRSIARLLLIKLIALIVLKLVFFSGGHDVDAHQAAPHLLSANCLPVTCSFITHSEPAGGEGT